MDKRISEYTAAAEQLKQGQYGIDVSLSPADELSELGRALRDLAQTLEAGYQETHQLSEITSQINAGLMLDEILRGNLSTIPGIYPLQSHRLFAD